MRASRAYIVNGIDAAFKNLSIKTKHTAAARAAGKDA